MRKLISLLVLSSILTGCGGYRDVECTGWEDKEACYKIIKMTEICYLMTNDAEKTRCLFDVNKALVEDMKGKVN